MQKLLDNIIKLEDLYTEIPQSVDTKAKSVEGVRIGKLTSISETGEILVNYRDNPSDPLKARSIIDIASEDVNKKVLLAFEDGNLGLPIIVGIVREKAADSAEKITVTREDVKDIVVDGKKMIFHAEREIELRCGKSSLIMNKDGRIVIKGVQLVSRASSVNKIKGAGVRIN